MRSPSRISRPSPVLVLLIAWLPASALAAPSFPAEIREVFVSSRAPAPLAERDLAHRAIDVHARRAIEQMSAAGDPELRGFAVLMARAALRGAIEGIFLENTRVPILRAKRLGMPWWEIVADGSGATCWRQPAGDAPVLVLDEAIKDDPEAVGLALREAFPGCGLGYLVVDAVDASGEHRRDCEIRIDPHANGHPGSRASGGTTLVDAVRPGTYRAGVRCPDGETTQERAIAEGEVAKLRIDPTAKDAAGAATPGVLGYAPLGPP